MPRQPLASVEQHLPRSIGPLSWLVIGGGSDPISNQISIEQDVQLATSMLAGRGLTLFASGAGALVCVEREREPQEEPRADTTGARVERELAALLGPPGALQVRYQPSKLPIDAPATRDHVLAALRVAVDGTEQTSPLLILAAGHGDHGATARENSLALWGGWPVTVEDMAEALEAPEQTRPTRLVVTSCYGGGFAELAFIHAKPQDGTRAPDHCGLFAAPFDDESSGCDPSPNRREQESYSIHFLSALRGQDRAGQTRLTAIDLDQDGRVSLREAHSWARIHSRSFDIPTSTSERYLREFTKSFEQARVPEEDREERAVVDALASELELSDERVAREKLRELDQILEEASSQVEAAQHNADDTFYALRIALLERWPLLDHSWDPRAAVQLTRDAASIEVLLTDSELALGNQQATHELDEAVSQHDSVRVARARVLRLVRAYETLRLASALKRHGGPRYAHYQALRECERFVPALRAVSDAVEAEAHAK